MTEQLTREKILSMPAGRELDALVAEKVMGWKQCSMEGVRIKTCYGKPPEFGRNDGRVRIPGYSTDISAAWEVVEKVKQMNWFFILSDNLFPDKWEASLFWDPNGTMIEARAETAPEAICKASLLAVMGL